MACLDCDQFENEPVVYIHQAQQPFCEQCGGGNVCLEEIDARCVLYHSDNLQPTHLTRLGMPNGASAERIFEAIDDLIGTGFNKPIVPVVSPSVLLTVTGPVGHDVKAEVILSPDSGNELLLRSNGLFVNSTSDGRVKVDEDDSLDYLETKIIGGTDGIVSNSVVKASEILEVQPSIDIEHLLIAIRDNPQYVNLICQIIAKCTCSAPSNVSAIII